MNQIKYVLVIFLLSLGCAHNADPVKPENLISKNKMVDVMIDLSIISSAKGMNKSLIERNGITPDQYVYIRHDIDSTQFSESNAYYSYFIDDYKLILQQVEDSLNKLKFDYNRLAERDEALEKTKKNENNLKNVNRLGKKRDSLIVAPDGDK
jgi:hypothetical protein